jgi:phage-related protein
MAKNKVEIDVKVDDKGTTKKVGLEAKKTAGEMDKVSKSSSTADRNLKGAARASSNGTKNFAKMSQGINSGLVPAYAVLAANIFAISAAFNFLKNASQIALLEQSHVAYAENTGVAMDAMTSKLRKASQGMLNFQAAAQASAIGLAKGFSAEQMNKIAEGALRVSNVLGRDFEDSFDRLVRGISKAEPELLDELGITLRLETAKNNYAIALNKTASSLTTAEQSQAIYLETMKQLEEITAGQKGAANPFVQLGTTFSDLIKSLTQGVLPLFESLASFINKNAVAALTFFGLIGVSILKSMPFINDLKNGFASFVDTQKSAVEEAKANLDSYKKKLEEINKTVEGTKAMGVATIKTTAQGALKDGATSPILQRAALGEMKGPDISNLKKGLASAEAQFLTHKKIVSGMFKGLSIQMVRDISRGLDQTQIKSKTVFEKMGVYVKKAELRVKQLSATISLGLSKALSMAGKAASNFGKAMNAAMKAAFVLAIIQSIYDMVMALINAPADILRGIASVAKGAIGFVQVIANTAIDLINYVIRQVNKIPGVNITQIESFNFADAAKAKVDALTESIIIATGADLWQQGRQDLIAYDQTLQNVKNSADETKKSIDSILRGKAFNKKLGKDYIGDDPIKRSKAVANAISSLGVQGLLEEALTIKDPEKKQQAIDAIATRLQGLSEISPKFQRALAAGDLALVTSLTTSAGAFTANIADVKDKLAVLNNTLKNEKSSEGVRIYLEELVNTGNAAVSAGEKLGLTTDVVDKLNEHFKHADGITGYIESLKAVEKETSRILGEQHTLALNKASTSRAPGVVGEQQNLQYAAIEAQLVLDEKRNAMQKLLNEGKIKMTATELILHDNRVSALQREIELEVIKAGIVKENATEIGQLGIALGTSLSSSMVSAFDGIIQGTMSAKEAFASMAQSMLKSIASVITELLVVKLLQAALGNTSFGTFLGITSNRDGGIVTPNGKAPGYAVGGIARGSKAGYPAVLHGTEAVVPLPNGKSIPVEMKSGGAQNNSVVVNVSVDSQGRGQTSTESQSGADAGNLGNAIAKAVQQELQNQKRSGGILNPYGVA